MIRFNPLFVHFFFLMGLAVSSLSAEEPFLDRPSSASTTAFSDQWAAFTANPADDDARFRLIASALTQPSLPDLSRDAQRYLEQAKGYARNAKNSDDYRRAIDMYNHVLAEAPWLSEAYYGSGLLWEKAGDLEQAARSYKFYLAAAPQALDRADIEQWLSQIDALEQQWVQSKAQESQYAEARELSKPFIDVLKGPWYRRFCDRRDGGRPGCTEPDMSGANWQWIEGRRRGRAEAIDMEFPGDGTAVIPVSENAMIGANLKTVVGFAQGPSLSEMKWQCRMENGHVKDAYFSVFPDEKSFLISCDRNVDNGNRFDRARVQAWYRSPPNRTR